MLGEQLSLIVHDLLTWSFQGHFKMYSPLEALDKSDMVVVCVDAKDNSRAVLLLDNKRDNSKPPLGIISLQKGVKNAGAFQQR